MKIIMSPHAGCYNHGCEAIVRSTVPMLDAQKDDIYLYSSNPLNDKEFGIDRICNIINNDSASKTVSTRKHKLFALKEHVFHADRDLEEISYKHRNVLFDRANSVYLSIGGDNYCYHGMQQVLSEQLKLFSYNRIPGILWGCSLEKKHLTDSVVSELKQYKAITVRESLSFELLQENGINENVILCSDPAFTLKKQLTHEYDEIFKHNSCIGINISPLMGRYNAYPDATYKNFKTLIDYLLSETDYYIVLIPHVRQVGNDDLTPIRQLVDEVNNERILVVDNDYNCMQLKDIIARCKMFIGCRTHSTIAAYSTCVPTLVVGYSTKSKGIAKDIFGDNNDLLVDVREFKSDKDLLNKYMSFCNMEEELRQHLQLTMPDYINKAYLAKEALKQIEL